MGLPKKFDLSNEREQSKEQANLGSLSSRSPRLLAMAPPWHTGLLVGLILAVFVTGSLLSGRGEAAASSPSRLTHIYLPMLLAQWGLALYAARIGLPRSALFELLGTSRRGHWVADIALAGLAIALILGSEVVVQSCFGNASHAPQRALLPSTLPEYAAWVAVAVSAGFCEELVYRGYLLRQLSAFSGSLWGGSLLSATLFGLAHAEQGAGVALRFGVYALILGALAVRRRTLVPGILAHIALDLGAAFSQLRLS